MRVQGPAVYEDSGFSSLQGFRVYQPIRVQGSISLKGFRVPEVYKGSGFSSLGSFGVLVDLRLWIFGLWENLQSRNSDS